MKMDKDKLESLLIEYIDGSISESERALVERELENSTEAKTLHAQLINLMQATKQATVLMPSAALKNSFDQLLARETGTKPAGKSIRLSVVAFRVAAAIVVLLVVGFGGYAIYKDDQYQRQLAMLKEEIERNKQQMMLLLGNEHSASQRMIGVSVAYEMKAPDDEIVKALVNTMNTDPNTNVRLSALDALGKFSDEKIVRKAMIESLSTQQDPVVQIALIQWMVKLKEKTVIHELERITKDTKTMKAVKDEAYSGIFKLS
jgi:hypothetical protein